MHINSVLWGVSVHIIVRFRSFIMGMGDSWGDIIEGLSFKVGIGDSWGIIEGESFKSRDGYSRGFNISGVSYTLGVGDSGDTVRWGCGSRGGSLLVWCPCIVGLGIRGGRLVGIKLELDGSEGCSCWCPGRGCRDCRCCC